MDRILAEQLDFVAPKTPILLKRHIDERRASSVNWEEVGAAPSLRREVVDCLCRKEATVLVSGVGITAGDFQKTETEAVFIVFTRAPFDSSIVCFCFPINFK